MAVTGPLFPAEGTTTSTGNQDDFDFSNCSLLRCDNATLLTLRGLAAGRPAQVLTIVSVGGGQVDLANQDSNSSAANRIVNGVSATVSLSAGTGRADLVYDGTSERWRVVNHEQGAWITPTFSAGDYTGGGAQTWTVASGDVSTCMYRLSGRTLAYIIRVSTTSVGGTPDVALKRTIPGGFTASSKNQAVLPILVADAGTWAVGRSSVSASGTVINFNRDIAGTLNWSAATDATYVWAEGVIEVA